MRARDENRLNLLRLRNQLLNANVLPPKVSPYERRVKKYSVDESAMGPVLTGSNVVHLPEKRLEAWVYNLDMQRVGLVQLNTEVFGKEIRSDIVHQVVDWQRAKARQGTHKQKNRGEVSGSGKKPFPQKGTGRSRAGTLRSPLHIGGGRAFPKVPRDYSYDLNKKVRRLGLQMALSAKFEEGNLVIIDTMENASHRTKELHNRLTVWQLKKALLVHEDDEFDPNFILAARNLSYLDLLPNRGLNVLDIVDSDVVMLTLQGLTSLEQRMEIPINRPILYPGRALQSNVSLRLTRSGVEGKEAEVVAASQ